MSIPAQWDAVLDALEQHRAMLLGRVADELTYTIPLLAVPPAVADFAAVHQRQMAATVARLHDGLQAARLHEQLLVYEFAWGAQALSRWGVMAEHLAQLIDTYIQAALALDSWAPEARGILEELRDYLHGLAHRTFPLHAETRSPEDGAPPGICFQAEQEV
ncbi:MAG: hypothetical protein HGA45_09730 [Chloroflexales bacterium]|nr:hypothetical protein [Chloroflexales bacterium]